MNKQWQGISKNDSNIIFCENYTDLYKYKKTGSTVVYFKTNTREAVKTALKLKFKGFNIIKFWTGTDVLNLQNLSFFKKNISLFFIKKLIKLHLTNGSWLSDELQELGIISKQWISPTPLYFDAINTSNEELTLKEKKPRKTVLIYSNKGREWLYNTELMLEIAKITPEFNFIFIGNDNLNTDYLSNTKSLGNVTPEKMVELYKTSHILLRITEHDGFPRMIIEALYFGLNVIFNNPIPNTALCSKNIDEIRNIISSKHMSHTNLKGKDYALTEFSAHKWIKAIQKYSQIF